MTAAPAVEVVDLCKRFAGGLSGPPKSVLDRVSFQVPVGGVFGLLGGNGSGKSTTLKAILGLVRPSSGHCSLFGEASGPLARRCVGYMPEAPQFPFQLTGRELVEWHGRLAGLRAGVLRERVRQVLQEVGLLAAADQRLGAYSKGMLQRAGLAQALVHDPALLILDEPTAGVDPRGVQEMIESIRALSLSGRTVLLTSHMLAEVAELCDGVAVLRNGRVVARGAPEQLAGSTEREVFEIDSLGAVERRELEEWLSVRGRRLHRVAPARHSLSRFYADADTRNSL